MLEPPLPPRLRDAWNDHGEAVTTVVCGALVLAG